MTFSPQEQSNPQAQQALTPQKHTRLPAVASHKPAAWLRHDHATASTAKKHSQLVQQNQAALTSAMQYVEFVKASCHAANQPHVFKEFTAMLNEFRGDGNSRIPFVIGRLYDIFVARAHAREIMVGFNAFLPPGYAIHFPAHEYVPSVEYPPGVTGPFAVARQMSVPFEKRCIFVAKVKAAFEASQPAAYELFLELLQRFHDRADATVEELHFHIATIFEGHTERLAALWSECGCAGGCVRGKGCCHACAPAAPGA